MKAEQLWASILQEAIQGRLVPQLESEPVVEQIGETPEDVPFDIPEKWKWVFLKSLVQPAKQKKPDRDFIYVDVSSIDNKNHKISNAKFIEAHNAPSRARKIIKEGMVLYATVRPYLKNICIAQQNPIKESIASTAFACMECKDPLLNKYLLAVLISPWADQYVTSVQKGVAYPAVSDKDFYELLVPLPPIDEQIRICASLDQMKVLINSYEQEQIKLEKLEKEFSGKLKSSILQEAIQGKLVPQLESEPEVTQIGEAPNKVPFEIPEKWKWVRLNEVGKIVGGGTPKTSLSEYWEGGTILWFTPADLGKVQGLYAFDSARKITALGLKESSAVMMPPNSVLFSSRAPIGHIALAADNCCTNQGCKSYVPNIEFVEPLWGYFVMKARTPDMIARASGTTFKEISGKGVGETLIPIPPIEEQRRIIAKLNELLGVVDQLEKTISAT